MGVEEFDWDDANIAHLALHGISQEEAEEVIRNAPTFLNVEQRSGELRRREIGATNQGRVLFVVSVARGYKIRVVTGWPASRTTRQVWNQAERRRDDES